MFVRRLAVVGVVAGALACPGVAGASVPHGSADAAAPLGVSNAAQTAGSGADAIGLDVTRRGLLAARLTWSGGAGPYDILIDPGQGSSRYESGIDDTTLTVATEPGMTTCFTVFGSDSTESDRKCMSPST